MADKVTTSHTKNMAFFFRSLAAVSAAILMQSCLGICRVFVGSASRSVAPRCVPTLARSLVEFLA